MSSIILSNHQSSIQFKPARDFVTNMYTWIWVNVFLRLNVKGNVWNKMIHKLINGFYFFIQRVRRTRNCPLLKFPLRHCLWFLLPQSPVKIISSNLYRIVKEWLKNCAWILNPNWCKGFKQWVQDHTSGWNEQWYWYHSFFKRRVFSSFVCTSHCCTHASSLCGMLLHIRFLSYRTTRSEM